MTTAKKYTYYYKKYKYYCIAVGVQMTSMLIFASIGLIFVLLDIPFHPSKKLIEGLFLFCVVVPGLLVFLCIEGIFILSSYEELERNHLKKIERLKWDNPVESLKILKEEGKELLYDKKSEEVLKEMIFLFNQHIIERKEKKTKIIK